ncbi:glycosyltransferase family 4 protein [Planctomyces sp. SH-PL62]|uniref:glycosyltransferase family 4 protein n=1 Tax=Planctomyces sp. SH-PL62 TaxID=1636152 RepID=UPI00078BCCD6|nr:glycosyltransferase family 4 protein [Planctomyces sp. SH-PL62]AMV38514.1 Alpha-D-kanosaminyltransferase [Planctomyces sp. SH-PL62]
MADGEDGDIPLDVVILAGRLGLDDDGWPLGPLLDRLEARGIAPRAICTSRADALDDPRVSAIPALGRRWLKGLAVRRVFQGRTVPRPAVLHAVHEETAETALAMAETWRIPYIQTVDDFLVAEDGLRISRRWLHTFVVSSEELRDVLVDELGVPADRALVIPPGVAVEPSAPRVASSKVPVAAVAGPPLAETGFDTFLEAARIVLARGRDLEFLIAVQGGDSIEVRRRATALRIHERVTVAEFDVVGPRLWSAVDVYCQPAREPSTGRTLTLALVQGVPCIASNVRGLRGLIQAGRSGLLVPPDDPASLADALLHLVDHPKAALELGAAARTDLRARFDLDAEADKLAALYRRAAEPPASPAVVAIPGLRPPSTS